MEKKGWEVICKMCITIHKRKIIILVQSCVQPCELNLKFISILPIMSWMEYRVQTNKTKSEFEMII